MNIQPTSLIARHNAVAAGTVNSQADDVYRLLCIKPMTIREIAARLGLFPGTVSARLADLRSDGKVKDGDDCKVRECKISKHISIAWEIEEPKKQMEMFKS